VTRIELLSFRQARDEACQSCHDSPCCQHLVLDTVTLDSVRSVDHALHLLDFDGIYLSVTEDLDQARVYLYQPCRHLDDRGLCAVHASADQPSICVAYQSQNCGYKAMFGPEPNGEAQLVDRARMRWLAEHLLFDRERRVAARPAWDEVLAAFAALPLTKVPAPHPPAGTTGWQPVALTRPPSAERRRFRDPGVAQPCDGCPAWCCRTLVFRRPPPSDAKQVDFLRYALGFPAVEAKLAGDGWALVVHTTCRHLSGQRCALYGSEARPIECAEYDEGDCDYRRDFGPRWDGAAARIGFAEFPVLARSFGYDDLGRVIDSPTSASLSQALAATFPADPTG
jgi:hypothetical protein